MIEVRLPIHTRSQQHGKSCHWAIQARERKQQRAIVALILSREKAPSLPCVVTLIRLSPGRLDDDNCRTALKGSRDQVAVWLGLPQNKRGQADDRDPRVAWQYQQGKGDHAVIVRVEEKEQADVDAMRAREEYAA